MRTDGPLTLNDVPMLLSVMRDMFGFAQQEFAEGVRRADRFSNYLGPHGRDSVGEEDTTAAMGDGESIGDDMKA